MKQYEGEQLWYHKVLLDMLSYLAGFLKEHGIAFWLDRGTLLGAVRNGRIIPWDFDIDLGIFNKDIPKLMVLRSELWKDGYDLNMSPMVSSKMRFFCMEKGIEFHIDLDSWSVKGDTASCDSNPDIYHHTEDIQKTCEIEFEGTMYPCPGNPEKVLERFFGADWKVPKVSKSSITYINRYAHKNESIKKEIDKYVKYNSA